MPRSEGPFDLKETEHLSGCLMEYTCNACGSVDLLLRDEFSNIN